MRDVTKPRLPQSRLSVTSVSPAPFGGDSQWRHWGCPCASRPLRRLCCAVVLLESTPIAYLLLVAYTRGVVDFFWSVGGRQWSRPVVTTCSSLSTTLPISVFFLDQLTSYWIDYRFCLNCFFLLLFFFFRSDFCLRWVDSMVVDIGVIVCVYFREFIPGDGHCQDNRSVVVLGPRRPIYIWTSPALFQAKKKKKIISSYLFIEIEIYHKIVFLMNSF